VGTELIADRMAVCKAGISRPHPSIHQETESMSIRYVFAALAACSAAAFISGCATQAAQSVSLLEPADGAIVSSPFKVRFGVKGMAVAPAGALTAGTGHHHLLINKAPIEAGATVPADAQHLHFGKGQTETEVTLAPGVYKLTAQFADGYHGSYGPAMSQTITVTVK
jgi:hypothetical protein